jgi:hypothetical protein
MDTLTMHPPPAPGPAPEESTAPTKHTVAQAIRARLTWERRTEYLMVIRCPVCADVWRGLQTDGEAPGYVDEHIRKHREVLSGVQAHKWVAMYETWRKMARTIGWHPLPAHAKNLCIAFDDPEQRAERAAARFLLDHSALVRAAGVEMPARGGGALLIVPIAIWDLLVSLAASPSFRDEAQALFTQMAEVRHG